ncbi:MAG: hypothetical protein KBS56_05695 [Clostridiales bacterium]|nr:hypothetical protein [Candidatus Crickella equi]
MVKGLKLFKEYFKDYKDQYVLIGGAACDINFEDNASSFRVTKDLDMVLIVEALTSGFGNRFWQFIKDGGYENKAKSDGRPQFYRFKEPKYEGFPKMIELFGREQFQLNELDGITPIHIDDEVSSLSGILLNDEYYECLLRGKTIVNDLSVLRPEYLILFKAKAHMDLKDKKEKGENVKSDDVAKHHKDIVRLTAEMLLHRVDDIPAAVREDMRAFINSLDNSPFNSDVLQKYGLTNEDVKNRLTELYL